MEMARSCIFQTLKSAMHKLKICLVLTTFYLFCGTSEGKKPIQLFKLFQGMKTCDLQIVYGDLESANIQPFPTLLLPTSLIFVSNFARQRPFMDNQDFYRFSIDISKTRVSHCQLSVLFSTQFIVDGKETKFSHWTSFGTDRHFRFGKNWSISTRNTYVVLVTNYNQNELTYTSLKKYLVVSLIKNCGIVFNPEINNNCLELCVLASGEPPERQNFNCVTVIRTHSIKFPTKISRLANKTTKLETGHIREHGHKSTQRLQGRGYR